MGRTAGKVDFMETAKYVHPIMNKQAIVEGMKKDLAKLCERAETEDSINLVDEIREMITMIDKAEASMVIPENEYIADYRTMPKQTNFGFFLQVCGEIDLDLIIGNCDMEATFVWDSEQYFFKDAGYEKFKKILDADYKILNNGNIEIFCDDYKLGNYFTLAMAGYIPSSQYESWIGEWE